MDPVNVRALPATPQAITAQRSTFARTLGRIAAEITARKREEADAA